MFGRIFRLLAFIGLTFGTSHAFAQEGAAAAALGGTATSAAAPKTLWRYLGIPQGFRSFRDVVANRRGNRPRMERKPPIKRIADPANLESEDPAIAAAAEIKQAEDMKLQKIKAIKYLAEIGCGCYDVEDKITDALIAATEDCTPDVRLAAIEAIEKAASGECCRKCGSTSCCNEKISKRLSELVYERDDSGCPIEASDEIRRAAKRVLSICCPGGPPTGPIEEEVDELIPAPEAEEEAEAEIGETGEEDEESLGESAADDADEIDETNKQKSDDPVGKDPERDDMELGKPNEENGTDRTDDDTAQGSASNRNPIAQAAEPRSEGSVNPRWVHLEYTSPATEPRLESTIKRLLVHPLKPAVVREPLQSAPAVGKRSSRLQTAVVTEAKGSPRIIHVSAQGRSRSTHQVPHAVRTGSVPVSANEQVVARVIAVNTTTGRAVLEGTGLQRISDQMSGALYRRTSQGNQKITPLLLLSKETSQARVEIVDRSMLKQIRIGDYAVFR